MDFDTLGEIIATRKLYFIDEGNVRRTVSVFIGKPQSSPDSLAYQCPFQIIGIGSQKTHLASGNDSIEALQSAIILIGDNLNNLNDELGGRLRWNDSAQGDLGFT